MSKENLGSFRWSERQRLLSHRTLQPLMSTFQRLAGKIFEIFLYRDQSFLLEALKPTEPQWSYC